MIFLSSPEDIFSLLLEREEEGGGEREKYQPATPICAQTRDRTHNLGMCPDWDSNLQPFGLQDDAPTNKATPARAEDLKTLIIFTPLLCFHCLNVESE